MTNFDFNAFDKTLGEVQLTFDEFLSINIRRNKTGELLEFLLWKEVAPLWDRHQMRKTPVSCEVEKRLLELLMICPPLFSVYCLNSSLSQDKNLTAETVHVFLNGLKHWRGKVEWATEGHAKLYLEAQSNVLRHLQH